jgi:hypothetical protein
MGKVDVIQAIFDSFDLLRAHWREVALPLLALVILSGAGSFGGSSFSNNRSLSGLFSGNGKMADTAGSLVANALSGGALLALGGIVFVIIALLIVFAIALCILNETIYLYVCEHFYALLRRKKVGSDWKARMKRLGWKAAVLEAFGLAVLVILFAFPALQVWNAVGLISSGSPESFVASLGSIALWTGAAILLLLTIGFFLTPLWVLYAMDGVPFFESLSRSVALVMGNATTFSLLGAIFLCLGIAAVLASLASCCLSWIVSPVIGVFLSVLWGITLMKVKLAVEK